MDREDVIDRIGELQAALDAEPTELDTVNSAETARSASSLAYLPYLTINDIIALRDAGIRNLEDIEADLLTVPEQAWDHVLDLVRARVIQVPSVGGSNGRRSHGKAAQDRCLALTKDGSRCRNTSREGSSYCSSHKGYQPSQSELDARRRGLIT